ncbi:hypothetical protein LOAG_09795 [Loa loa]|uniref:Uncharacterized protein n=1 Tax=Loa loa TaxID=7209 RepID=A0A1S0TR10_LOALO|nr:hypothetical protein LOAG_09795 [Loa loa]EFO18698.1 hypothetical protein LOAG_09795 [Loa loa]
MHRRSNVVNVIAVFYRRFSEKTFFGIHTVWYFIFLPNLYWRILTYVCFLPHYDVTVDFQNKAVCLLIGLCTLTSRLIAFARRANYKCIVCWIYEQMEKSGSETIIQRSDHSNF